MGAAVNPIRLIGAVGTETVRADSDRDARRSTPGDRWDAGFAGRVVDDMDQPLAGALVVALPAATSASPAGPLAGALPLVASTRADGRFVLPAVPPGRYLLFAIHAGPPPATSDALVVDGRSLTVPLRLVITRGAHLL